MPISLVLLPGLDGTGLLFSPLVRALPPGIEPIVVAYPGDHPLTYQELLPLVMDRLPKNGNFVVLGESFSGPLAVLVAASRPPGLAGLILCATFVNKPWRFVGPIIPAIARTLPFRLYFPLKRLRGLIAGVSTTERANLIDQISRIVRPEVIAFRVRMVFQTDLRHVLGSCAVPILYLRGTRDWLVPKRNMRVVQAIQPGIQISAIVSSHMILQRRSAESADAINRFVRSLNLAT